MCASSRHRCCYCCSPPPPPRSFGASADHWRKNLPVLGRSCRAYAIDLLGYGYSSKPDPRQAEPNALYNFGTWSRQLRRFTAEVIGEPTALACNSVGGLAGLQAALDDPSLVTSEWGGRKGWVGGEKLWVGNGDGMGG